MRFFIAIVLLLLPLPVFAQAPDRESVGALIKKLASPNFPERQAASKALLDRPEAEQALREAMRSGDVETRRRAADILDYFDRRSVRDLQAAIQDGRVDYAIELLARWPAEKHEEEAWDAIGDLTRRLVSLHEKKSTAKVTLRAISKGEMPLVVSAKHITETTKSKDTIGYFLRADQIEIDFSRGKAGEWRTLFPGAVMVCAGPVRTLCEPAATPIIFARGPIELAGVCGNTLIVSGADVVLKGDLGGSLVIARGKVTCTGNARNSGIISGSSIVLNKKNTRNCLLFENDANPLGYIRWDAAPQERTTPKRK